MQRHRHVAAAPIRSAPETWEAIVALISDSVSVGPNIDRSDVGSVLVQLGGVGPMLIAGGHLERNSLTIRAATLDLDISTLSGVAAIELDENLNVVPGAATATTWDLYLPAPEPHAGSIEDAVAGDSHLHVGPPPASVVKAASTGITIDIDSLSKGVN